MTRSPNHPTRPGPAPYPPHAPASEPPPTPAALREAIALRIREAMARTGTSGTAVARRLGVSQPTVHAWMVGTHGLRRHNIHRLAAELGVDPAWLEFGAHHALEARAVSTEELAFLRLFRDLDATGRASALRLMHALARTPAPG